MTIQTVMYIVIGAAVLLVFLSVMVLLLTWLERKALARIQMRMGPMRVGFHGALQPIADAMKLVSKEDILPSWADCRVYWLAPIAVFIPAFLLWVTIPVARDIALANLDLGLFYIVAISVLSVMGLVMAGWSSANKYAMLGGLRAAGQLVSYEIPFIMAILAVAMLAQTLNLRDIVEAQSTFAYVLDPAVERVPVSDGGSCRAWAHAVRHSPRGIRGRRRPLRRVQRRALGRILPRRVHQHLHDSGADGADVPRRLGLADDAVRGIAALSAVRAVVHAQDIRRHPHHILDTRHIPAPADRPANGVWLEAAGAALVHQHRPRGRGAFLRMAALGAIAALCGNISRHLLHNCQKRRHTHGAQHGFGA